VNLKLLIRQQKSSLREVTTRRIRRVTFVNAREMVREPCPVSLMRREAFSASSQMRSRATRKMATSTQREARYIIPVRSLSQAVFHLAG